jgi:putative FmdB family regulatory protein
MPTYGYRCGECGHELEVFQSMSDAPLRVCPQCGGPLGKMLYPVGVHFKGSGFYTTDYKNNGSGEKADPKDDAKSEGKSEGKKDAKSDPKSDAKSEPSPSKEKPSTSETKPETAASKE